MKKALFLLVLSLLMAGCGEPVKYTATDWDTLFKKTESLTPDHKGHRYYVPIYIDHLKHSEWTTIICTSTGKSVMCVPQHHERDDYNLCKEQGSSECRKYSSYRWNQPEVDGPGNMFVTVDWDDGKFLWWRVSQAHPTIDVTSIKYT